MRKDTKAGRLAIREARIILQLLTSARKKSK